jgi:hypothetical protein
LSVFLIKFYNRNKELRFRNQEPGTRIQEPGTRNQEPGTRNQEPGLIIKGHKRLKMNS